MGLPKRDCKRRTQTSFNRTALSFTGTAFSSFDSNSGEVIRSVSTRRPGRRRAQRSRYEPVERRACCAARTAKGQKREIGRFRPSDATARGGVGRAQRGRRGERRGRPRLGSHICPAAASWWPPVARDSMGTAGRQAHGAQAWRPASASSGGRASTMAPSCLLGSC